MSTDCEANMVMIVVAVIVVIGVIANLLEKRRRMKGYNPPPDTPAPPPPKPPPNVIPEFQSSVTNPLIRQKLVILEAENKQLREELDRFKCQRRRRR